jgi:hypothetical protein
LIQRFEDRTRASYVRARLREWDANAAKAAEYDSLYGPDDEKGENKKYEAAVSEAATTGFNDYIRHRPSWFKRAVRSGVRSIVKGLQMDPIQYVPKDPAPPVFVGKEPTAAFADGVRASYGKDLSVVSGTTGVPYTPLYPVSPKTPEITQEQESDWERSGLWDKYKGLGISSGNPSWPPLRS